MSIELKNVNYIYGVETNVNGTLSNGTQFINIK